MAEARRVMKPPETERSRTLSILAKATKDDRTIFELLLAFFFTIKLEYHQSYQPVFGS